MQPARLLLICFHACMQREKAVPDFQLGAFLVEHANLIEPLEGSNGGHVIQAAKLAQQQLRAEVRPSPRPLPNSGLHTAPDIRATIRQCHGLLPL